MDSIVPVLSPKLQKSPTRTGLSTQYDQPYSELAFDYNFVTADKLRGYEMLECPSDGLPVIVFIDILFPAFQSISYASGHSPRFSTRSIT